MKNSKQWTRVACTVALLAAASAAERTAQAQSNVTPPITSTPFIKRDDIRAAHSNITVMLNDRELDFGEAEATQSAGRVLVPMRGVFEALGASVAYDPKTEAVSAVRGTTRVQLHLRSAQASVNGQVRLLDVPAQTRLGRTLVPLRFVPEALGARVSWSDAQHTVYITTGLNPAPPTAPKASIDAPVTPATNPPATGKRETLSGVVTSTVSGYSFRMHTSADELVTVQSATPLPATLKVNSLITVTGVRGAQFQAEKIVVTAPAKLNAGEEKQWDSSYFPQSLPLALQYPICILKISQRVDS